MKARQQGPSTGSLGRPMLPKLLMICAALWVILNKDLDIHFQLNPDNRSSAAIATSLSSGKPALSDTINPMASTFSFSMLLSRGMEQLHRLPLLLGQSKLPIPDPQQIDLFVKSYGHIAITERQKFGIPSSVLVASAILLSDAASSTTARQANNFFGLPCTQDWKGATFNENGNCLRSYENPWTSFRDFSLYMTTGENFRYRQLKSDDYQSWAKVLEGMDFHQIPNLEKTLTRFIRKYNLQVLDED